MVEIYTKADLAKLWYLALEEEYGIKIEAPNIRRLMNDLYSIRDSLDDPALRTLEIANIPGNILYIHKKTITIKEIEDAQKHG